MSYLIRTEFVLQTCKQHLDNISDNDPNKTLLSVFLTFLICISFYSEAEIAIVEIVKARLNKTDKTLAEFIINTQKTMLSRLNKSDLSDCAKLFGTTVREIFNTKICAQDAALYKNLIVQRHMVAHSEDGQALDWHSSNLTMLEAEDGLKAAERLLCAFETALQHPVDFRE